MSVCLSVLSRWKQLDRYVSTIQAAVPGEQSAQPRCETKTRQTNGSTLHSAQTFLCDCVCTTLNVSTLYSFPGLMVNTGSGNLYT